MTVLAVLTEMSDIKSMNDERLLTEIDPGSGDRRQAGGGDADLPSVSTWSAAKSDQLSDWARGLAYAPGPGGDPLGDGIRQKLIEVAAQLDASRIEILALQIANRSLIPGGMLIASEIECLRVERDSARAELVVLRARRERLRIRVEHLEHVGPCRSCGDRAQDLRDILEHQP